MTGKVVMARKDVVSTEHPLASMAGLRSVQEGGNAFDAAASASLVLSVVQPQLSGLGGDFFGLFFEASTGRTHCLNASGWSPSSVEVRGGRREDGRALPLFGHASAVVPGYLGGVFEMHRRFGRLPFSSSVERAIALAEEGFVVGPGLASAISHLGREFSDAARRTFLPSGEVSMVGRTLKQPELARTLREISESGVEGFYRGGAADAIQSEMASGGVDFSRDDLSSYSPEWCDPLKMEYRGTEVFEVPPNSMGATSLHILNQLEKMDMGSLGAGSGERIKVMVEAARVAYAARDRTLGDPRFSEFDLRTFLESETPSRTQSKIDKADTTYFAVADHEGNVLSCIQSIFHIFGSRVFVPGGGFFMNNRGSSFGIEGPNRLEPRKRPLHTLSSLIISKNGSPMMAMGASGGEYRPQQHALLTTNVVDYGMDIEEAIAYPRFLWDGSEVEVEEGYSGISYNGLQVRRIPYPGRTGVAQGLQAMPGYLKGVADIRGEGLPAGE